MFEETRPYNDSEIPAAIARVASNPFFETLVRYLFPDTSVEAFRQEFLRITTIDEFQEKVMLKALRSIVQRTCTDFTWEGFNLLDANHRYTFIANHRDILLDAALLQVILNKNHLRTSEITFGSNLMRGDLVIDIGKMNKMFRIERGGTVHSFYRSSMEVSSYMRYALLEKGESTWIAQRNGRTKDGRDLTESAVLKMFSISSPKPFVENLAELNITPVAISYEYEPCDALKARELALSENGQHYQKYPGEDFDSIKQGIFGQKGKISLVIGTPLDEALNTVPADINNNDKLLHICKLIDEQIYKNYKLYATNYIAHDLMCGDNAYSSFYTPEEKEAFVAYLQKKAVVRDVPAEKMMQYLLHIYGTPVDTHYGTPITPIS